MAKRRDDGAIKRLLSPDNQQEVMALATRLDRESDRGMVLIVAANADNLLEHLLRSACISETPPVDKGRSKAVEKLLASPEASLGSFSARICAAYAFGFIPETLYRDLEQLREARNHCAHNVLTVDFTDQKLRAHIDNIVVEQERRGFEVQDTLRIRCAYRLAWFTGKLAFHVKHAVTILQRGNTRTELADIWRPLTEGGSNDGNIAHGE